MKNCLLQAISPFFHRVFKRFVLHTLHVFWERLKRDPLSMKLQNNATHIFSQLKRKWYCAIFVWKRVKYLHNHFREQKKIKKGFSSAIKQFFCDKNISYLSLRGFLIPPAVRKHNHFVYSLPNDSVLNSSIVETICRL